MTQELETIAAEPEASKEAPVKPKPSRKLTAMLGLLAALGIAFVVYSGIRGRQAAAVSLAQTAQSSAFERVSVIHPQPSGKTDEIILPANMQAYVEAPIYARTHGYLKRWYFDIGAHVKQGDLMAEIETPEVDQQLQQAQAVFVERPQTLAEALTLRRGDSVVAPKLSDTPGRLGGPPPGLAPHGCSRARARLGPSRAKS